MRSRTLFWAAAAAMVLLALGCGKGRTTDEIRVEEYSSLTGTTATFGQSTHNAVTMAYDELNGAGGRADLPGQRDPDGVAVLDEPARYADGGLHLPGLFHRSVPGRCHGEVRGRHAEGQEGRDPRGRPERLLDRTPDFLSRELQEAGRPDRLRAVLQRRGLRLPRP